MSKHLEELEEISRLRLGIILLIKELEKNRQLEPIYMYLKDLIEGVDENGEDGICLTVAKVENGEICFLGNCYGENARCLDLLIKENQELKKQVEVSNELVAQSTLTEMKLRNEFNRWKKEYQDTYKDVRIEIKEYKTQQKEFISYLNNEKDRLSRECSQIYEDSLGKTRLVNEDIFNAINDVLQKYKEIIGDDK